MKRRVQSGALLAGVAAVAMMGFAQNAQAASVTGNPLTDGWTSGGNSLTSGVYVRGGGAFDFDVYSTSFTLAAGSNLLGDGWQVGDTILGIGGVIQDPDQTNLTSSLRLVGKFGTDPAAWSPAPTGLGSLSSGHGGDGAILLATYSPADDTTYNVGNMAGATVHLAPLAQVYDGGVVNNLTESIGKIVFNKGANNEVTDWEILLNVTLLESLDLHSNSIYPQIGDRAIVTLQRSNNSTLYTDALTTVDADAAVVPLPAAAWAGLVLLGGMGGWQRWRGRS